MAMLLSFLSVYAYDFEIDGIGYTITSFTELECELTSLVDSSKTEVQIPDDVNFSNKQLKVTAVGTEAFANNISIVKVMLGHNVKTIGRGAFKNCSKLREIAINPQIANIQDYAFQGCVSLTSLIVPNSTSIGAGMLKDCSSLTDFVIPNESKSIPSYLFSGCVSITNISIPSNVITIDNNAFEGCVAIHDLTIPSNVKYIQSGAFNGCIQLEKLDIKESNEPLSLSYSTKSYHEWSPTYSEYFGLFRDCPIKSLIIGRQLEFDSSLNFVPYKDTPNGYNKRRDVYYPPFCNKSLDELVISASTKVLPHNLFYECNLTGRLEIKDDINPLLLGSIFTRVTKQGGSSTDGRNVVYNNFAGFNPSEVYIGRDIQYYYWDTGSSGGFYETPWKLSGSNLYSYEIGNNVTDGYPIVLNPVNLRNLVIGNGVTEIKPYFCEGAENLTAVYLGNAISIIGKRSFSGCKSLVNISFPSSLSVIEESAFYNCENINSIDFNTYGCDILADAFTGCASIESIRLHGSLPTIKSDFSNNVYMSCTLEIPTDEKENVTQADIWKNFWNVRPSDSISNY